MLEKLVGLQKMTIHQCQALAQKFTSDGASFDLVGPKGRKPAKWLDAHMGFFQIDGSPGFVMVSQVEFARDLWCENLRPAESEPTEPT